MLHTYRVGDDADESLGGDLGSSLDKVSYDGGVGVEQVITRHAGLARHSCGDDDHLGTLQRVLSNTQISTVHRVLRNTFRFPLYLICFIC